MDAIRLAEMMRATLSENKSERDAAEEQLNQVCKIIGFVPSLLQIVVQADMPVPVRQATAIYLKNFITKNWREKETDGAGNIIAQMEFSIHEQDRSVVRENIIESLIQPHVLGNRNIFVHITTCIYQIIKNDYPHRWPRIVEKIQTYLQSPDYNSWTGAILCLHQLVKNYEYKKADERGALDEAMTTLLPMIYTLMVNLMQAEQTSECVLLQKNILKIYYTLIQFCLPLDLITQEVFSKWMEICRYIIDSPVPVDVTDLDEDERLELPWWKAKKWAMHICVRTFERYGSPGNEVNKDYKKFAEWYLPTFTRPILESLLKMLDSYRNNIYVTPRVLTEILSYMKIAVSHAHSWTVLKPHMLLIIQEIIFPIMQYTEEDEDLYQNDTIEYIRRKFDIYDDYSTPVPAAQVLFLSCCKVRKGILPQAIQFLNSIIRENTDPKKRDGALYMIGSISEVLLKKKEYRNQIEQMLTAYVFPEFSSQHGHMRARACWVLQAFADIEFKTQPILVEIIRLASNALLTDTDLPVKVEAAIVLQVYLSSQEGDAHNCVKEAMLHLPGIEQEHQGQNIQNITMQLLKIIRDTEIDDLNTAMQTVVMNFSEYLTPIVVNICKHLEEMFTELMQGPEGSDDREETANGLLDTIEKLLSVFEENPEVAAQLQPCVIAVVRLILEHQRTYFYEEAFSLIYDLTSKTISPDMWAMLGIVYNVFKDSAFDCFLDLMPALHNYITIDTEAFLSDEKYMLCIFDMCKTVLTSGDAGEDAECHAAKLIEVIILQCMGRIDKCIPTFVELAVTRLMQEVKSSELRTMCLQILIAALYYNPALLINILKDHHHNNEPLISHFIKQWINDTDCFLGIHDRKLYVLGICRAISLGLEKPYVLGEVSDDIIPKLLLIFEGLKRAYQSRAQEGEEEEDDDGDGDDDDDCEEALSSDEDEVDENNTSYLDSVKNFATKKANQMGVEMSAEVREDDEESNDSEISDFEIDETTLETYLTPIDDEEADNPIDEYIAFQQTLTLLEAQDPQYYVLLMSKLSAEQKENLLDVIKTADQKKAQYNSKQIQKQGGFQFAAPMGPPPTNFNFSS